eukprot:scaffold5337_cov167-Amphora_coffeaeformis.AAC.2
MDVSSFSFPLSVRAAHSSSKKDIIATWETTILLSAYLGQQVHFRFGRGANCHFSGQQQPT